MTEYTELIEVAIEKMMSVVNKEVAIRQARKVPDLEIDDDGAVTDIRASGKDVLRELVKAYTNIMGSVAASLIAYELRDQFDVEELDLPENLSKHL